LNVGAGKSIGIIGLGTVGRQVSATLIDYFSQATFYLASRSLESSIWAKREMLKAPDRITPLALEELSEIQAADLLIITADGNKTKGLDRSQFLETNIDVIRTLSSYLKGYNGSTLIVTNPVDELCYLYTAMSGANPKKVVGNNHLDPTRLKSELMNDLSTLLVNEEGSMSALWENTEVYTIGPHNELLIPVFRKIGGLAPESLIAYTPGFREALQKKVADYGKLQMRYGGNTAPSTAIATRDIVSAFFSESDVVCCSTYVSITVNSKSGPKELEPLFTGYPVQFRDGTAIPRTDLVEMDDYLSDRLTTAHSSIQHNLEQKLFQTGIIKRIDINSPSVYVTKLKFPDNTRVIGSAGNKVYMWDPNHPNSPEIIFESEADIGIGMSIDDNLLFGTKGGILKLNLRTGKSEDYVSDMSTVRGLSILHSHGNTYIAGSGSKGLCIWDYKTHKPASRPFNKGIWDIAANGEETLLFLGRDSLYLYNMSKGLSKLMEFECIGRNVRGAITSTGDSAYFTMGRQLHQYDLSTKKIQPLELPHDAHDVRTLAARLKGEHSELFFGSGYSHFIVGQGIVPFFYKEKGNKNSTARILAQDYLIASDYNDSTSPKITIWNYGYEHPLQVLNGVDLNRTIRSLIYLNGAK
jgi:malate/lactate dehydrogenase